MDRDDFRPRADITLRCARVTSHKPATSPVAAPPADMCGATRDARFVPIADISKQLGLSDFGPTVATA